jgi:hypothetical protein
MSKISISTEAPIPNDMQDAKLVYALKGATGLPVAEIQQCLSRGTEAHLYRAELYLNDHVEVASTIRRILTVLREHGVGPFILEILYDESWDDPIDPDVCQLSEEELLNALDGAMGRYG